MAIFPNLELEAVVQVDDKTRLNAVKTYISKGEFPITKVEIEPEAAAGFSDITGTRAQDWFLDWQYATPGTKVVTVQVTTTDSTIPLSPVDVVTTYTKDIDVVDAATDNLFSADSDLIEFETDILKYVRDGRNSWLDFHRKAQELIVAFFDERGNVDANQAKITKVNFKDLTEVVEWSTVLTLRLIFSHLSTQGGTVFKDKAALYKSEEIERRNRVVVRLDLDLDGTVSLGEYLQPTTVRLYRR